MQTQTHTHMHYLSPLVSGIEPHHSTVKQPARFYVTHPIRLCISPTTESLRLRFILQHSSSLLCIPLPRSPPSRVFPLISSFWAVLSGSNTSSPYNVWHPVTVRQGLNQRPCSRVHWPVSAMLSSFGLYPAENHLPPRGMAPFSCWADSLSG